MNWAHVKRLRKQKKSDTYALNYFVYSKVANACA